MVIIVIAVIAAIVAAAAALFALGLQTGKAANPPTDVPKQRDAAVDCAQACTDWDNARQRQCGARSDEAAARSRADGIRNMMLAAIAAAVSLSVAGAATLVAAGVATATYFGIPAGIVLTAIAVALFVLAAAAFVAADVLAGQLAAAEADAAAKARARQEWDTAVAVARAAVNASCPTAEANACLSRQAPC